MRTDIHRPSEINPADYYYICTIYHGSGIEAAFNKAEMERLRAHMEKTGGRYSDHEHGGTCHVCGAFAMYLATFYHAGSNTYIRTGEDCAAKMYNHDGEGFRAMRKAIGDARQAQTGKRKAQAVLSEAGLDAAWVIYEADLPEGYCREEEIITDIVGKLVKWGSISENQTNFLRKLLGDITERPAREAKRAAEKAAAADCPKGRVEITGTVIKTELKDSPYGDTFKMTVKDDKGFLVWGTVPSSLELFSTPEGHQRGLAKGDRVKFTATVTPGDRDPKFGFYKRPTKAALLQGVA